MTPELCAKLGSSEIAGLSSSYIDHGVKRDSWRIDAIDVQGPVLRAELSMVDYFVSPTDPGGFHLTIFSTQEFLAQLSNIYLHLLAGAKAKTRETWMRESAITTHRAIRTPERMSVEMHFFKVRRFKDSWFAMATARVSDEAGGLFTAKLKGILS